ncbi:hypothetical protein C8R46DRAFT_828255, partial [Mycena filopes]
SNSPAHIPRPRNAFILFRCHYLKVRQRLFNQGRLIGNIGKRGGRSMISKGAAVLWQSMGSAQRQPYFRLAEAEKAAHALQYPHYRYEPAK